MAAEATSPGEGRERTLPVGETADPDPGTRQDPPFVVVGHVARSHGTRGELFVWPLTDHPEHTFVPGVELVVAGPDGHLPDPEFPPLVVAAARPYRKGVLVSMEGVEGRSASDRFHGRYLLRPFEEVEPLQENEIFYHQLLGLEVRTAEGERVGRVVEVFHLEPVDLVEVDRGGRTVLIPFRPEVIQGWDLEAGVLRITPPEGLLEL